MEAFVVAASAVIPLFLIIAFGFLLKYLKVLSPDFISLGNRLCFQIFIPTLLFCNIYQTDIKAVFDAKIILFVAVTLAIIFVTLWIVVVGAEKDNRKRGVLIQGMMRSNFVVLGVPIVNNIFGDGNSGLVGLLLSVVLPMYNILSVFTLEYFAYKQRELEKQKKEAANGQISLVKQSAVLNATMWKNIFYQIITNNLIIASVIAYALVLLEIKIPGVFMKSIWQVADVSTGFSLIILGASFQIKSVHSCYKQLFWAVLTRLVFVPAFALGFAVFFGFRGIGLASLAAVFASPTSVSSFSMTQIIGGDGDLSANIIVFTSLFSIFSLFIFIYLFEFFKLL